MPRSPPFLRPRKMCFADVLPYANVVICVLICYGHDLASWTTDVVSVPPNVTPCFRRTFEPSNGFYQCSRYLPHQTLLMPLLFLRKEPTTRVVFFQLNASIPCWHKACGHHSCDRCWQDASYDASVVLLSQQDGNCTVTPLKLLQRDHVRLRIRTLHYTFLDLSAGQEFLQFDIPSSPSTMILRIINTMECT